MSTYFSVQYKQYRFKLPIARFFLIKKKLFSFLPHPSPRHSSKHGFSFFIQNGKYDSDLSLSSMNWLIPIVMIRLIKTAGSCTESNQLTKRIIFQQKNEVVICVHTYCLIMVRAERDIQLLKSPLALLTQAGADCCCVEHQSVQQLGPRPDFDIFIFEKMFLNFLFERTKRCMGEAD